MDFCCQKIISQLKLYGISAERKALYEDIGALKMFGLDIVSGRGNNSGYYVVNREFELHVSLQKENLPHF